MKGGTVLTMKECSEFRFSLDSGGGLVKGDAAFESEWGSFLGQNLATIIGDRTGQKSLRGAEQILASVLHDGSWVGEVSLRGPSGVWRVNLRLEKNGTRIEGVATNISLESPKGYPDQAQGIAHLGKLVALEELIGGLAHEINNPLSVISGFTELMEENFMRSKAEILAIYPKFHRHLLKVKESGDRIKGIMAHLKELIQKEAGEISEIEISNVIENSLRLVQQQFENRGIRLLRDYKIDVYPLMGDAVQLEHVFVNVMAHCRDALSKKYNKRGGRLIVQCTQAEKGVKVSFVDDGGEVDPEGLSHIFDRRYGGVIREGATGIGLSVARQLIEAYGGSIQARNNEYGGLTIDVWVPVRENLYLQSA